MAITVAFDGTVVNASDVNTNWAKLNEGGGSPAAEAQLAYQNALAVNNKCTKTGGSFSGVEYDPGASPIDMTNAAYPLCFLQMIVADSFDLNTTFGAMAYIGSSSGDFNIYNFAGSGAARAVFDTWPAQGGYILTGLNPTVAAWEDATSPTGTPALTAVDYFAFQASFVNGATKSENVALDQISIGRGLILTGNTPDGEYEDFQSNDEGTSANRWGVVFSKGGIFYCVGKLTVGSATATSFTDTGTVIMVFPDGYVDSGDLGELYDIQNASTDIFLSTSQLIGGGSATTAETRPSLTVSGTTGAFEMDGAIRRNYEVITFTSVCDVHGVDISCESLIQNSCDIYDSVIRTTSLTSVACLQTPIFGTTTDLRDSEFIQEGAGHAIELATVGGTYNMQGLTFTGYGADTTDSAALDITAATGTTTLNLAGMATPTYKTAGASVVVNNNKTVTFTGLQLNTEVRVYLAGTTTEVDGVENSGSSFGWQVGSGVSVDYVIHHPSYEHIRIEGFSTTTDTSIPINQRADRNYSNP